MIYLPSAVIKISLLCGIGIFPVLIALSHGSAKIDSAKTRFLVAISVCYVAWFLGVCLLCALDYEFSWYDVLASAAIILTATVAWGMLWSLVCWGFTTSLLAALSSLDRPANRERWFRAYGGGSSIADFSDNRLSILLAMGLARFEGSTVTLTGNVGKFMALLVLNLRKFYGISNES